ncbi:MAG: hypothetical protein Q4G40_12030 [Brachybacterium sp.]|nr:hypothetical protein [Brachybacterium sp.]
MKNYLRHFTTAELVRIGRDSEAAKNSPELRDRISDELDRRAGAQRQSTGRTVIVPSCTTGFRLERRP